MSKLLTATKIKKGATNALKKEKYELDSETHIMYNPIFAETKLQEMFAEMYKVLPKESNAVNLSEKQIEGFLMLNIIKKFTSLGTSLTSKTFDGQAQELQWLLNNEDYGESLYEIIINDVFDTNQLFKVKDKMMNAIVKGAVVKDMVEDTIVNLGELELENEEVLENLKADLTEQ